MRADLEFYIPQIIAHFLRKDLDEAQSVEITKFILQCCESNLFFAHKVWFNLKACLINKHD